MGVADPPGRGSWGALRGVNPLATVVRPPGGVGVSEAVEGVGPEHDLVQSRKVVAGSVVLAMG